MTAVPDGPHAGRRPTVGKTRRLSRLTDHRGVFQILAIDHRDSLRAVVDPADPHRISDADLVKIKLDVLRELAPLASGVMLDPVYGVEPAISTGALPRHTGFMTALESQGYLGDPKSRQTTLLPGWSVEQAARVGADAVKLLIFYHPDSPEAADRQRGVVASVVAECEALDMPLFLEPVLYPVDGCRDPLADRRSLVIDSARDLSPLGADVMKMQFPVAAERSTDEHEWTDACHELDSVVAQPWAILSGGESIGLFTRQVEIAGRCGCSGFMAGRAVWADAVTRPPGERREALASISLPRFASLCAAAADHCRPVRLVADQSFTPPADWHSSY